MNSIQEEIGFTEQLVLTITGKSLSNIQKLVLQQSWQGVRKTYDQIAEELGYSPSYIKKTVAPKLWKLLSVVLGEKVGKTNFRSVIERQHSYVNQKLESHHYGEVQTVANSKQIPEKIILNLNSEELEFPEGRESLNSPFYIERVPHESRCYQELLKPGAMLHIAAPRQMGKTSLLIRILAQGNTLGYETLHLNLQQIRPGNPL